MQAGPRTTHAPALIARALAVLALATGAALSSPPTAATGVAPKPIATYCSPTGDLCFGVFDRSGAVSLELTTFARYFARYHLCVTPPRGTATCKSFPVRESGRLYASRVRWHRNFPARGPGQYRVAWKLGGALLGPRLGFRLPLA